MISQEKGFFLLRWGGGGCELGDGLLFKFLLSYKIMNENDDISNNQDRKR